MTWEILWGPSAKRALLSMPRKHAERVAAAVIRFAETGEGGIVPDMGPAMVRRLHVDGYRVLMSLDPHARRIWVKMVYRADR